MASTSQHDLQTFNARETFAITLRILERLEKVDQGVMRNKQYISKEPADKLLIRSEDVLVAFRDKVTLLQKAVRGLDAIGDELGRELATWYSVRRGQYSSVLLDAVSHLWTVLRGEVRGFGSMEDQCETMYSAVMRSETQDHRRRSTIGPHLLSISSPRLVTEEEEDSSHSESAASEDNSVLTVEDSCWDQLCLPSSTHLG